MAGVRAAATTAEIASGTSLKTLLQLIAAANHRAVVTEVSISFKGTSNTAAPVLVQVAKQTSGGTMSALTPVKYGDFGETLQTTATHTATVEPTTTDVYLKEEVHPQTGFHWQAPFGEGIPIAGGARLGILVTAGADVNAVARVRYEE